FALHRLVHGGRQRARLGGEACGRRHPHRGRSPQRRGAYPRRRRRRPGGRPFPQRGGAPGTRGHDRSRPAIAAGPHRAGVVSRRVLSLCSRRGAESVHGGRFPAPSRGRERRYRSARVFAASLFEEERMKRNLVLFALSAAFASAPTVAQQTTLNVVTAGDQNMVDYIKDFLAPRFEKSNPKAVVKAVGTGPGDGGSQKIAEKLQAQKGNAAWDVDVAVIHQKMAGDLVREGLLAPYVRDVSTGRLVTSEASKNALGTNVQGYVIPMFQSQIAIAYNPALVKNPPKNYEELAAWAKANPKKFGYNGIKGGMSGVGFVVGWVYANTPDSEKLMKGPYDANTKAKWD